MLYLFIDTNQVKILYLKKSIIGQFEASAFSKTYQSELLQSGKISNIDFVASAVKEGLQSLSNNEVKDKETLLILPQESYTFLRISIPSDIAQTAIDSFVKDKTRSNLPVNLDECTYDYFVEEGTSEKTIHFFAVKNDVLAEYKEALHLIDLKLSCVVPESVTYFKLFQKTLRKDKKESIFYVTYSKNLLTGFLYDSFGQTSSEKWISPINDPKIVENILKEKVLDLEKKGTKLNRLILAGEESETVRQDTFTKAIGVWTNPLKRILPEFYGDYLKVILDSTNKPFSFLSHEVCVGAFIFHEQNKNFSLLRKTGGRKSSYNLPKFNLPVKEIVFFLISFIVSFILLTFFSKTKFKFPTISVFRTTVKPTVKPQVAKTSPTATPTPTPSFKKEALKIKVLNGSGAVGKATDVKDILKAKGYQNILTDNADNFNYTKSELQVKKSKSEVTLVLETDLKDSVSSLKVTTLAETEAADVVLIIGQDFK